jgi:hypothetical protein
MIYYDTSGNPVHNAQVCYFKLIPKAFRRGREGRSGSAFGTWILESVV